jgi:hypothetical protein
MSFQIMAHMYIRRLPPLLDWRCLALALDHIHPYSNWAVHWHTSHYWVLACQLGPTRRPAILQEPTIGCNCMFSVGCDTWHFDATV